MLVQDCPKILPMSRRRAQLLIIRNFLRIISQSACYTERPCRRFQYRTNENASQQENVTPCQNLPAHPENCSIRSARGSTHPRWRSLSARRAFDQVSQRRRDFIWQNLFPASKRSRDPRSEQEERRRQECRRQERRRQDCRRQDCRHHLDPSALQRAVRHGLHPRPPARRPRRTQPPGLTPLALWGIRRVRIAQSDQNSWSERNSFAFWENHQG